MKTRYSHRLWIMVAAGGLLTGSALLPVRAQAPAPPAAPVAPAPPAATAAPAAPANTVASDSTGRFYVELKGSTLYDAIAMVQQAAGSTDYKVDESAKYVPVEPVTFNNAPWDTIIRRLATDSNFKIVPQKDGSKQIEPRYDMNAYGGEGGYGGGYGSSGGGYPGGGYGSSSGGYGSSSGGGYPGGGTQRGGNQRGGNQRGGDQGSSARGGLPASPFSGGNRRQPRQTMNEQTAPGLAGASGAANAEGKEYRVLQVRHVYVGGIASLFGDAGLITSEQFLIPESALGGNNNGGGGFGNNGGGFGGGGFGNNGGGFGGGGFGNNGGGFGGGGFGGGGFGGGGFGGGGFGGGGFGNNNGGGFGNNNGGGFGF